MLTLRNLVRNFAHFLVKIIHIICPYLRLHLLTLLNPFIRDLYSVLGAQPRNTRDRSATNTRRPQKAKRNLSCNPILSPIW